MPFLVVLAFGALAIALMVLFRRRQAASAGRKSSDGGDAWSSMMWNDSNVDESCVTAVDESACSGGDAGPDGG